MADEPKDITPNSQPDMRTSPFSGTSAPKSVQTNAGTPSAAEIAAAVAAAEIEKNKIPLPKAPETPAPTEAVVASSQEVPATTPPQETQASATSVPPEPQAVTSQPATEIKPTDATHPYTTSIYDDPAVARIRTFKSDVADAVRTQNMSLARMAIKEDEQREEIAEQVKTSKRWSAFTIVSIVFFLAGGLGLVGYFYFSTRTPTVVAPPKNTQITPLIPADEQGGIDTTALLSDTLRKKIKDELSSNKLRLGFIKNIYFVESTVRDDGTQGDSVLLGPDELFTKLSIKNADRPGRLLNRDFMFGVHSFNAETGFLILRFESYPSVAAELLSWEKTMRTDILPILTTTIPTTASTTTARTGTTTPYTWNDEVIQNIDTRTLRDQNGTLLLLYSFMGSRDTVLVCTNEATFREVLARYQNPRTTR